MSETIDQQMTGQGAESTSGTARLLAAGGILGAIGASACCILPLVLFSLGITGAWIGQLTALSAYKAFFIIPTLACLAYGYWLVYRQPKAACADGTCTRPLPNRIVKGALWFATALIGLAMAWPYIVPILLG